MTQNNIIKVGVTGGAGSGKTILCNYLRELGYPVIYADLISKDVLVKYEEINHHIRDTFGEEFFNEDGSLRRKELGKRIFLNEEDKIKLENIIIPFIIEEIFIQFKNFEKIGKRICFLDAPTLFENDLHKDMDYSILICVDEGVQLDRVIKRDNISREDAINIIKSQMSQSEKMRLADFIVYNNSSISDAKVSLKKVVNLIEDNKELLDDSHAKKENCIKKD